MYNDKYDRWKIKLGCVVGDSSALFAGIFLCAATFCMFVNMMTRTFADYNFRWIYDFCGLCAAGIASYSIPYTTFNRGHSNMDIIISKLKPSSRGMSEAISGIFTIAVMAFTIIALTKVAIVKTASLELTTSAHLPTFIFRWLYIIGLILTVFAAALEMIDMFRVAMGRRVITTVEELEAYDRGELHELEIFESETQKALEQYERAIEEKTVKAKNEEMTKEEK